MPHEQKSVLATLFTTILVFGYFFLEFQSMSQSGILAQPDAGAIVGKAILWLIGASVVINIVAHILMSIIFAIATNDSNPSFVVDERDKIIEMKGMRISFITFGIGFVASIIALATGTTPAVVFILIIYCCAAASITDSLARLYLYRRGF